MTVSTIPDAASPEKPQTPAETARYMAALHKVACRYRAQGLVCSMCHDTEERAARLEANCG